jgi:ankyrin repeat protein
MNDRDEARRLVMEFVDAAVEDQPRAKRLLKEHPELLTAKWMGESPLHFLVVEGFPPKVIRFLAQQGFDVNAINDHGSPALVDAVVLGNAPMIATLIELGANLNVVSGHGLTPLETAASAGRPDLVDQLLRAGASPTSEGLFGGVERVVEMLCPILAQDKVRAALRAHGIGVERS